MQRDGVLQIRHPDVCRLKVMHACVQDRRHPVLRRVSGSVHRHRVMYARVQVLRRILQQRGSVRYVPDVSARLRKQSVLRSYRSDLQADSGLRSGVRPGQEPVLRSMSVSWLPLHVVHCPAGVQTELAPV